MMDANETVRQLGGQRFIAMTGAHTFTSDARRGTLTFRIGRNPRGVQGVRVTLEADDTYTVEFFKINPRAESFDKVLVPVSRATDIYCDTLADCVANHTGLAVRL